MKWGWWLLIGAAVAAIGYASKNKIMELWDDAVTWQRLEKLHPAIRERAKQFIAEAARLGIFLRVTDSFRTFQEQADLYAKGRTAPGSIVTNSKPGSSFHNYALAFDVVEIKDGKGLWDNPRWKEIGALGKSFGFKWGGDFTSLSDMPHFEYGGGRTIAQLRAMYDAKQVDSNGYLTQIPQIA